MAKKASLFQDPLILYPLLSSQLEFAEYIRLNKVIIKNTRLDLANGDAEKIIDCNAPFELSPTHLTRPAGDLSHKGKGEEILSPLPLWERSPAGRVRGIGPNETTAKLKYGVIAIHGLLDSGFIMRDFGEKLRMNGALVRGVLLPGHGTIPGALLHVDYLQWVETVKYAIDSLAKEVEQIYIIGYSTGATLALYHAARDPRIAGVVLLSSAFKINCLFDFLSKWPSKLDRILPRAAWFYRDLDEGIDYVKYSSMPFNAIYQVYLLTKEIQKQPQPTCPIFIALTENDLTISGSHCVQYFLANTHTNSKMILYSKNKPVFSDNRITVRSSVYPQWNIRDFSHITIPVAPDNPHYGMHGDYADASHVKDSKHVLYGEYYIPPMNFHNQLYRWKLARYQYQRLTFNPDFEFLGEQIKLFVFKV